MAKNNPGTPKRSNLWSFRSARLYLSLTFFLAIFANALMRNTLSMGMVCMVNSTTANTAQNSSSECASSSDVQENYQGEFLWDSYAQGLMFSALFIGGLLATLPAGWLADRYDPKTLVSVGILATTVGCFLSPVTAQKGGYVGLIVLRLLMGLFGQALIIPGITSISARWIPPAERSTVIALWSAGNQVANIVGMPMNALLCGSPHFLGGWPAIFYVNAVFGLVSGALWIIFANNRPEKSRFVSEREKTYISTMLANQNLGTRKEVTRVIPWKRIIISPVVLSILVCNFAAGMMAGVLTSYIPTYFKDALNLSLTSNGLFGALPYIVQWIAKIGFALLSDLLRKHTKFSPTMLCKSFNTLSFYGVCVFLIACAYMNCSTAAWAIVFLSLANAMFSANIPGFQTSIISIAPPYSGIIMAIARFSGQFAAFMSPLIIAALTPDQTADEWKHVFFLIAGVMLIAGTLFLIFGSASIQDWAKMSQNKSAPDLLTISQSVQQTNGTKNNLPVENCTDYEFDDFINNEKFLLHF